MNRFILPILLLTTSAQAEVIQCSSHRGHDDRWWSYRIVDHRPCWYPGRPGRSKKLLAWGPARTSLPLPVAGAGIGANPQPDPGPAAYEPVEPKPVPTVTIVPLAKVRPFEVVQAAAIEPVPLPRPRPSQTPSPLWLLGIPFLVALLYWLLLPPKHQRRQRYYPKHPSSGNGTLPTVPVLIPPHAAYKANCEYRIEAAEFEPFKFIYRDISPVFPSH